jgi:parvulin-like peptidyl-prolyl isomerase
MKQFFSIILLTFLLAPLAVFGQTDLQPVATVSLTKTESISVRQLKTAIERLEKEQGQPISRDDRPKVLDGMIDEKLILQAAERDRITVAEGEITEQVNQLRMALAQRAGRMPNDAEMAAFIRSQYGVEMPAFREQIRAQLMQQRYIESKNPNLRTSIKAPTEEEILNYYNIRKAELIRPDTVRFSMIQVPYGNDSASKTRAKELMDRLYREIGSDPAKLDEIVIRAQAQGSGYQGGDGMMSRNPQTLLRVGEEFMNIAFTLRQGAVSRIIEGPNAYHVIKIKDNYPIKILELDDIMQIGSNETVRENIRNLLLQAKDAEALQKAYSDLVAELRKGNPFRIFGDNLNW